MSVATRSSCSYRSRSAALGRLLADELGDADRRGGLGGERGQEAPVVGRVLLLGQARAQVERADQLALADQRDDQRDAGLAKLADRRRVQLERREVDRTRCGLEVGEQRVARAMSIAGRRQDGRRGRRGGRRSVCSDGRRRRRRCATTEQRRIGRVSAVISCLMLAVGRPGIVTASSGAAARIQTPTRRAEGGIRRRPRRRPERGQIDLVAQALGEVASPFARRRSAPG